MFLPQTILKIRSESSKSFIQFNISYVILKSIICHFVYHSYVNRMYSCVTRRSFACHFHVLALLYACTWMPSVCHSYVCHPYVTRMYSYVTRMNSYVLVSHPNVTRMSSVCVPMSLVCHSYVVVCHPYVFGCHPYATRMWFYREPGRYKVKDLNDVNIISYIARKVLLLFHLLELFFIFYLNSRNVSTVSKW